MSNDREAIIIEPSYAAYVEFIAAGVVLLFYVAGLFILAWVWYDKNSRAYKITHDKIVARSGMRTKTKRGIRIANIREVIVRQGTIQKYFDVGNVRILMTELDQPPLDIRGIPHPVQLGKLLNKYRKDLQAAAETQG